MCSFIFEKIRLKKKKSTRGGIVASNFISDKSEESPAVVCCTAKKPTTAEVGTGNMTEEWICKERVLLGIIDLQKITVCLNIWTIN